MQKHVSEYTDRYPETNKSQLEDTYVDDIQGGGDKEEQAVAFKEESTKILAEANFPLHKWHSNVESLDEVKCCEDENDQRYAESLAGNKQSNETKILGVPWNKKEDTFSVSLETIANFDGLLTKRRIISEINSFMMYLDGALLLLYRRRLYSMKFAFLNYTGMKKYQMKSQKNGTRG